MSQRVDRPSSDTTRTMEPSGTGELSAELPGTIGPYRILDRMGRGGMGEVFLAHDATLDRKVALKRVRTDREGDADLVQRFEVEARVTALL